MFAKIASWFGGLTLEFFWGKAVAFFKGVKESIEKWYSDRQERKRLDEDAKVKAKRLENAKTEKEFDDASRDIFS